MDTYYLLECHTCRATTPVRSSLFYDAQAYDRIYFLERALAEEHHHRCYLQRRVTATEKRLQVLQRKRSKPKPAESPEPPKPATSDTETARKPDNTKKRKKKKKKKKKKKNTSTTADTTTQEMLLASASEDVFILQEAVSNLKSEKGVLETRLLELEHKYVDLLQRNLASNPTS